MSNEEKIFEGLEDIRSELAIIETKINDIELQIKSTNHEAEPTPEEQSETIRLMHELFPFTDEENEEFGKYMD